MKNADKPAMPLPSDVQGPYTKVSDIDGLTKREMFAMHAMSTVMGQYNPYEHGLFDSSNWQQTAENCVGLADALLAELEK